MLDHKAKQLAPQLEPNSETYFAPQPTQNWQPFGLPDKWVRQHSQMKYIFTPRSKETNQDFCLFLMVNGAKGL